MKISSQLKCVFLVSRNEKGGTKVLSAIQLVERVHGGKKIDSVYRSALVTPLEMLEGRQIDMKPVD
ncbi:hypothetical protein PVK06_008128 [Gossypium arboreum]|uniref:Uncharacterized protein n=1 Tax=Gossypium arboreum TaxID=29729 RepID=A0ABR0QJ74_GOSAR|nr:hypothetical protein PVK06_008128 [Gossypium arboreum]